MTKTLWRAVAGLYDLLVVPSFGAPGFRVRSRLWKDKIGETDLIGRVFVVTGANAGLGRAMCRALALRGATVHMVCRNRERGARAQEELTHDSADVPSATLHLHIADMSELASVRALAADLRPHLSAGLHGLIHNAGVLLHERDETSEGRERTFATHVAGPFLLTRELVPALQRGQPARVVFVASGGMYTAKLDLDLLQNGHTPYDGLKAYALAKRAQVILARKLHERLTPRGIMVAAMHPGWADTGGVQRALPGFRRRLRGLLRNAAEGADTAVWLATAPEAAAAGGRFFLDRLPRREHIPFGRTRATSAEEDAFLAWLETEVDR